MINSFIKFILKFGFLHFIKISYFKLKHNFTKGFLFKKPPFKEYKKEERFFLNEIYSTQKYLKYFSKEKASILERSEKYIQKEFRFLGCDFIFKDKINWHFDPNDKVEWERKDYDERNLTYSGSPKDAKIVWELNRHQYLFTLAKACWLTKDKKYSDEIVNHILSWIRENPKGINWASPMEIAIRIISWTFALDLIEETAAYKYNCSKIIFSIYEQSKHLSFMLSTDRVVRTNHLLGELAGLFVASSFYDFKESKNWQNNSINLFVKELSKQVYRDGVSKEQSTSYHRFVLDFTLTIILIAKRFKIKLPDELFVLTKKIVNYLDSITQPNEKVPAIGDSDDGRGIKLSEEIDFWNMEASVFIGTNIFPNLNKKNINFNEEAFWFIGNDIFIDEGIVESLPKFSLRRFDFSGHYVIKKYNDYLFIRAGEFGMGGEGYSSHSHDDLLSPIIFLNGNQILIDSGTFVYNGNPQDRKKFKTSGAHNNINWNGLYSKPKDGFGWKEVYNCKNDSCEENNKNVSAVFSIDKINGYSRKIFYDKSERYFEIADNFNNKFRNLEWNFHLAPGILPEQKENEIQLFTKNEIIGSISFDLGLKADISNDKISLYYGEKIEIYKITFLKENVTGEVRFKFFR